MAKKPTKEQQRAKELRDAFQNPAAIVSAGHRERLSPPPVDEMDDDEPVVVEGLDDEQPVERVTVDVTTTITVAGNGQPVAVETRKEVRERCPSCGKFVAFKTKNRRPDVGKRYVECPACGRRHVLNLEADTIREVASR